MGSTLHTAEMGRVRTVQAQVGQMGQMGQMAAQTDRRRFPHSAAMEGLPGPAKALRAKCSLQASAGQSFMGVTKGAAGIWSAELSDAVAILECTRWSLKPGTTWLKGQQWWAQETD